MLEKTRPYKHRYLANAALTKIDVRKIIPLQTYMLETTCPYKNTYLASVALTKIGIRNTLTLQNEMLEQQQRPTHAHVLLMVRHYEHIVSETQTVQQCVVEERYLTKIDVWKKCTYKKHVLV